MAFKTVPKEKSKPFYGIWEIIKSSDEVLESNRYQ